MHYFSLSFTHKNTDISLRERLSLADESKKTQFLKLVFSSENIAECLVISTCNRVELLCFVGESALAKDHIVTALAIVCNEDKQTLASKADIFEDKGAIHHLFSVASSLDSLVVGETQIAGQLKDAFNFALAGGFCGTKLKVALDFAFKCAARVRNETQISKNPISVASVAVAKAKQICDLSSIKAVVVGAGEMAELACKHLLNAGAKIIILNRNIKKAESLAKSFENAEFDSLLNLENYLNSYELFFTATSSQTPIITQSMLKPTAFKRYFFDIAIPRDVELSNSDKIAVFAVDDLQGVVRQNLALREKEATNAYSIVSAMSLEFFNYLKDLELIPLIKELRLSAKECAFKELEKAINKGYLKHSDKQEAQKLIHQVFKAFLHTPTVRLKHLQGKNSNEIIEAVKYIFNLKKEDDNEI